ncbi:hypothetical protein CsatB_002570 [Cannabis sativa]
MESTRFNKKKIFIGGLPHQIEEAELKTYFSDFGTVVTIEILREKITDKGRGFGFVTFDSEEAVEKVLENKFYNLKEKQIEVKMAEVKTNRRNRNIPTTANNLNQSLPDLASQIYYPNPNPFEVHPNYWMPYYNSMIPTPYPYEYGKNPMNMGVNFMIPNQYPYVYGHGQNSMNMGIYNPN